MGNREVEKEFTIDGLDGGKKGLEHIKEKKSSTEGLDTPEDSEILTEEKNEESDVKTIIEGLCDEELRDLLEAKQSLEEKNQLLDEKGSLLLEYEDLLKRKQAEFENYRKRVQKEIAENRKYAITEIVLDIINILDDFERAVSSAELARDFDALIEGIVIIEKQFRTVLENKYGVKMIEAVGKEFDPNIHDAVMMEESAKYKEDTVVEDLQKGYIMHDRIIRPAKVKVAKSASSVNDTGNNIKENEES